MPVNEANVPFLLIFGLIVVMLVRSGELRLWVAIVSGLFGFYLAMSGASYVIDGIARWVIGGLTSGGGSSGDPSGGTGGGAP